MADGRAKCSWALNLSTRAGAGGVSLVYSSVRGWRGRADLRFPHRTKPTRNRSGVKSRLKVRPRTGQCAPPFSACPEWTSVHLRCHHFLLVVALLLFHHQLAQLAFECVEISRCGVA